MFRKIFKKKFNLIVFLCFVLFFMITGVYIYGQSRAGASGPAVFLLPHQDDEIFLAGSIKQHVVAGRNVHVVMVTDGGSTRAKDKINTRLRLEGRSPLSRTQLIEARNNEFMASMISLGVNKSNIHFANKEIGPYYIDGKLTKYKAREVIDYYYNKLGNGSYKTVSAGIGSPNSNYSHNDHKALFLALRETSKIGDQRFYNDKEIPGVTVQENITYFKWNYKTYNLLTYKKTALENYFLYNPNIGRYSVGYFSVSEMLRFWQNHRYEYYIKKDNALKLVVQ